MPLPLAVPLAAAAVAGTGAAIKYAAKVGKNTRHAGSFQETKYYDPNASKYGGKEGGLEEYNSNLHNSQLATDARGANIADYTNANWDRQQAGNARQMQNQSADLIMNRARGLAGPSIAEQQAQHQIGALQRGGAQQAQSAMAAQTAQAASARGAAGMALAGQTAANNTANAQASIGRGVAEQTANISGQAQVNAASERMNAEQAAFGAYSGIRGGDMASQGQNAAQEQFQAQQQQRNRDGNDQRAMGYEQLKGQASNAALQASVANQGQLAQSHAAAEVHNAARAQKNADNEGNVFTDIFKSDTDAKEALPMSSLMSGGGGGAAGNAALSYFLSDTNAKKSALVAQGQQQGIALARGGGGSDVSREDVDAIRYGSADDAALDDRFAQNQARAGASDGIGKPALDAAIGQSVKQDSPTAQWSRSFGDVGQAQQDARQHDNMAEMQKIQAGFAKEQGPKKEPWYMQDVEGPATSGVPTLNLFGFKSDAAAKQAAFMKGVRVGGELYAGPAKERVSMERPPPPPTKKGLSLSTEEVTRIDPKAHGDRPEPAREWEVGARPFERGKHVELPPQGVPKDREGNRIYPDASPVAEANRTLAGSPYAYKSEHTPPSQQNGEPNFGPMAQNLEKSPIAATAVKVDPASGLRVIDRDKALKVAMSGIADLQRQQDELRIGLSKGGRR